MLVALGLSGEGEKLLLAMMPAGAESTATWQMLLEDLVAWHVGRPELIKSVMGIRA